jgi:serine protease
MKSFRLSLLLSSLSVAQGASRRFLEEHERTRVFLRYGGIQGRRKARKCAGQIYQDNPDDDVIIMDANSTCMQSLAGLDDIIEIDYDNEVQGMGMLDGDWEDAFTRALNDVTPWGIGMIQADQVDVGDHEVTVCIVDSGIASGHPDFASENINGTDTVKFYGEPWLWGGDKAGHGTHVAGIIGASANGVGVTGVTAGNLKIHITRALDDNGSGYESDIRTAVEYCIDAGAKVINLSLGGPYMSYRSAQFYERFVLDYGVIMVAAAGNDGNVAGVYPAAHPNIISVSAVEETGLRWEGSSYGEPTELSAPGHKILSTYVSTAAVRLDDSDSGFAYPATAVNGAVSTSATGNLELCDASDNKCKSTGNGDICLYLKSSSHQLSDLVEKCISGGGAGMVVFTYSSDGTDNWSTPASIPVVAVKLSVGLLLKDSNLGEEVTIGDVGGDNVEYSYAYLTGTSMASPHVAAAAALLWSNFADCNNHQIRYALAVTASHPEGNDVCDDHMGYGIIKVKDAFDWLENDPCDTWEVSQLSTGGCTTLHQD